MAFGLFDWSAYNERFNVSALSSGPPSSLLLDAPHHTRPCCAILTGGMSAFMSALPACCRCHGAPGRLCLAWWPGRLRLLGLGWPSSLCWQRLPGPRASPACLLPTSRCSRWSTRLAGLTELGAARCGQPSACLAAGSVCRAIPVALPDTAVAHMLLGVGCLYVPQRCARRAPRAHRAPLQLPPCPLRRHQVIETAVSIAIIRLGVAKFEPLPDELFKYDLR